MRPQLLLFHWGILVAGLVVAGVLDIRSRRVPNWLTVGIFASGVTARWLTSGAVAAAWGLAGGVLGLVILIYPFARRWIGAGDVKLLAACGAWLGPLLLVWATLGASFAGGIIALIYLGRSPAEVRREIGQNLKYAALTRHIPQAGQRPQAQVPPYAPAIAVGTLAVVVLELCGIHLD